MAIARKCTPRMLVAIDLAQADQGAGRTVREME